MPGLPNWPVTAKQHSRTGIGETCEMCCPLRVAGFQIGGGVFFGVGVRGFGGWGIDLCG